MEKKMLKACKDNNKKALRQYLDGTEQEKLLEIVRNFIESEAKEILVLLRGIFEDKGSTEFQKKIAELYTHTYTILNEADVPQKFAADITGFLLIEVDVLSVKSLVNLIEFMINSVRNGTITNGKSLELFPKILAILSNQKSLPVGDGEGEMRGPDYKSHALNTLCSCRWNPKVAVHLATMLRDIEMTQEELLFVVKKVIRMFTEIDLQDVPALCYQLLLLSSKGHKRSILDGICSFMNEKDIAIMTEVDPLLGDINATLRQAKGTIILHITFAIKQDQDLGRAFLKYLKGNQSGKEYDSLTPFNVAVALAISSIKRLEEGVFDYLKSTIVKIYKEDERRKNSFWFRELFPEGCQIDDVISSVLKYSKYGWDDVVQGLVQFGFMLMDSYTPRQNELYDIESPVTASQRTCSLGGRILRNIFEDQDFLREEIITHILNTIATRAQQNASHYIDVLASLAASMPQVMLDCLPRIKEVFDYISLLTPSVAEGILHAVLPLMKISLTMKDSLVLVLRKSMFARQAESRKIAVTGFLLILKHFKIPVEDGTMPFCSQFASTQLYSCSQVEIPSGSRIHSSANESLCLEILGNLRRCLTHQDDVRLHLYEGMFEVASKNPRLTYPTLELLNTQFKKYYEPNEDIPAPIKLEACVSHSGGQITLAEPLGHLLNSLQLCAKKSGVRLERDDDEDEPLSHILDDIEEMLKSLTRRMVKAELEDFELDKSADFTLTSSVGIKNNIYAKQVSEIYEVLIEYNWMTGNFSEEAANNIIKLYGKKLKVKEMLSDKAAATAGKKSKVSTTKQGSSLLSLKCLAHFLQAVFCDTDAEHEKGIQPLRETLDFSRFLVVSILQKLTQIHETKLCDGPGGKNPEHIVKQCCSLGRTFLFAINGDTCLPEHLIKKDKSRKLTSVCVEGLQLIVSIMCTHFSGQLARFLNSLEFSANLLTQASANDPSDAIHRHMRRFQRMSLNIFVSPDDDIGMKEGHALINVMANLVNHLDHTKIAQSYTWLQQVCAEHNIDDASVVKSLLSLLLTLHRKSKASTNLVRELSQDIHSQLGDIDEEVEVENRSHYAVVNPRTVAPAVFLILLGHIDKLLEEFEWILNKLKNEIPGLQNLDSDKDKESETGDLEEDREKLETSICHRMIGIVTACHELVQSAFPEGNAADSITKTLTKLYGILASLSKYHLSLYNQRIGHLTVKFEKLVKLTGTHLTQQTYAMITYMQATQNIADESMTGKAKKTKNSISRESALQKNRAMKESKLIPNLIYAIEQYERFLIQLSKKSKVTNLMEHFKLSTSRDFRINGAFLEAALQENEAEDEEERSVLEKESTQPSSKRAKLSLRKT